MTERVQLRGRLHIRAVSLYKLTKDSHYYSNPGKSKAKQGEPAYIMTILNKGHAKERQPKDNRTYPIKTQQPDPPRLNSHFASPFRPRKAHHDCQ